MKILRAKLFCRPLFWMVIWFLILHMEDLSWGLAAIFMCPNVFWGLDFQSRPPQFLQVQFFVLATNFAFNVTFGERKAGAHRGHPEMRNTSASLFLRMGRIRPAVFSDRRLWYWALCFTSLALHWSGECADMGLNCKMEICLSRASNSCLGYPEAGSVTGHPGPESPLMQASFLPFMERNSCCLVPSECLWEI